MKYNGVNFYDESVKSQTFKEFKGNWKHLEWNNDELKQVYNLITNKDEKADETPPSFIEPSSVSRENAPGPEEENN